MIKAEDLFSRADEIEDLQYKQDIPLMKEIIEEVDSVFGDTSNRRFDRLKRALNKFNDKWTNTEPGPLQLKSIRTLLK